MAVKNYTFQQDLVLQNYTFQSKLPNKSGKKCKNGTVRCVDSPIIMICAGLLLSTDDNDNGNGNGNAKPNLNPNPNDNTGGDNQGGGDSEEGSPG